MQKSHAQRLLRFVPLNPSSPVIGTGSLHLKGLREMSYRRGWPAEKADALRFTMLVNGQLSLRCKSVGYRARTLLLYLKKQRYSELSSEMCKVKP